MASKTQICNLALAQLGEERLILDISDGTPTAALCSILIDQIIDEVIIAGPWPSSTYRAELAQTTPFSNYDFTYGFILPEDPYCLRVLDTNNPESEYKVEGRTLVTDSPVIHIKYLGRPSDVSSLEPNLVRSIAYRLKEEIGYSITGGFSIVQLAKQQYEQSLILAFGSKQETQLKYQTCNLIRVR